MSGQRLLRSARMGLVLVTILVVQVAVVADLRAFDALGDLMLLLAIAAGSVGGPNRGAVYGFSAGLAYDLMLDTPFGLSPLVYALVGFGVGVVGLWFVEPRWWVSVGVAAMASALAVGLMVAVAAMVDLRYPFEDVARIAGVVAAWNAVLILPARRLLRWVIGEEEPDQFRVALP